MMKRRMLALLLLSRTRSFLCLYDSVSRRGPTRRRYVEPLASSVVIARGGSQTLANGSVQDHWAVELRPNTTRHGTLFANVSSVSTLDRLDSWYDDSTGEGLGVLRAYFAGAKRLWGDVGEWRKLRKEKRALTWREQRVVHDAPRHLARMFPILVNPLPPPLGFVLIAVASLWPRALLTPEFWTLQQWLKFSTQDSAAARSRYTKVLTECLDTIAKVSRRVVDRPQQASSSNPSQAPVEPSAEKAMSPWAAPLSVIMEPFEDGAPLGLDVLSRRHLVRLARVVRPRPLSRWFLCLTRTSRLRAKLRKAAQLANLDDDRLAADFSRSKFDTFDLFRVCSQRGLAVDGSDAHRARRVQAWLDARRALLEAHPDAPLPPSFILHMPALFSALMAEKYY